MPCGPTQPSRARFQEPAGGVAVSRGGGRPAAGHMILETPLQVRRLDILVNPASGSVSPGAQARAEKLLCELGVSGRVIGLEGDIEQALRAAVDAAPDVLAVLAGDGTARACAELCGPDGPVLAPLPGGTMNMLPRAVYGQLAWPEALSLAIRSGEPRPVGGGEVDGRPFLVAAILGAPALWAPAREAVREGRFGLALDRARNAFSRAFTGRLRYSFDRGVRRKAEALAFLCPLTSRAMESSAQALEAAALDPADALEAFRLGAQALLGDWRDDPSVEVTRCRVAQAWAAAPIPALVDGEPVQIDRAAQIVFRPNVVRVLALAEAG